MRETKYATELASAGATDGGRIERLRLKDGNRIEIRFSWWKDGRFQPRPLDLTEEELLPLLEDALKKNVFTAEFLHDLNDKLTNYLAALKVTATASNS